MVIAIQFTIINDTIILLNHQDQWFCDYCWGSLTIFMQFFPSPPYFRSQEDKISDQRRSFPWISSACLLLYICSIKDSTLESLLVMIRTTSWNVNSRYFLFSPLESNQLVLNRPSVSFEVQQMSNLEMNHIPEYRICYLLLMGLYVYDS